MFADRAEAGRALAEEVARLACMAEPAARPVVAALPRGGAPVGFEVARRLGAPLVVVPVAKVGAPGREELALGAVAPGGVEVLNDDVLALLRLDRAAVGELVARAAAKVARQQEAYGGGKGTERLAGAHVVVVDVGLATGASMKAALLAVRQSGPARVRLAVPVATPAPLADDVACVLRPEHMHAVGAWYEDFTQTTDAEVARLVAEAGTWSAGLRGAPGQLA